MADSTDTVENCSPDYVRRQIEHIEAGLSRALAGDYSAIRLEDADTLWGTFAMHLNVVINATRTALTRAERFEREAAEARERAGVDAENNRVTGPVGKVAPRDFVIDPHGPEPRQ